MLEVKNLYVSYGRIQVISDFSFSVGKEAVGLFGPNGAGKTTLINSIIGLVKPKEGEILFEGESLLPYETHTIVRKGISVVPQDGELFPIMSVLENLKIGAAYIKEARDRVDERLEFVFKIFPMLKERAYQLAGTMSGGQQRMLAVGRSLMALPRLLILDEPSVGLQPSLVSELFEKLSVIKSEGVSMILSEQNVRQGLKVIDRGYVIENGTLAIESNAEDLMHNEHVKRSYLGL
ncbi:ABC transporter ATP-binding protein [Mesotoga sp.]|mgnify:FL=1|jgi:branched-chain amino acid transport system ATP-binding protein|uniref:ABC-type branched-chain amino acid transport system ATPase component n=2 Tax=Mesotoga infera TaxID=1236046 RepID=A0A101I932_9BACT|nr:MAG: ABC-type branched-chain amino acid transport system ATPase component [Mesotoga infera]HCO69939.1 branched-chain amino acid ABC transporter ATP-binding protein [Mesotoga infera]